MATLKVTNIKNESFAGDQLYLKTDGKIGIGTTSPLVPLQVKGSGSNGQIYLGGSGAYAQLYADNDGVLILSADHTNSAANSYFAISIDTSEKFRIKSDGKVGIGTTSPTSLLHLKSNAPYITFEDDDNNQDWRIQATAWFAIRDETNSAERMRIDSSGRLLLGTTTEGNVNADDFTIEGSAHTGITVRSGTSSEGSIYFSDGTSGADEYRGFLQYQHSSNEFRIGTNALTAITINSSQRVGIGTTSPAKLLDVEAAAGGNYIAHFRNGTSATPYTVQIEEPNSPGAGYPLLNVNNNGGTTEWFRIDSGRGVTKLKMHAGAGIDFSANSHAGGMTSELLDGYEEGTFTPVLANDGSTTYTTQTGRYVKIGSLVHVIAFVKINTEDGSSGSTTGIELSLIHI